MLRFPLRRKELGRMERVFLLGLDLPNMLCVRRVQGVCITIWILK